MTDAFVEQLVKTFLRAKSVPLDVAITLLQEAANINWSFLQDLAYNQKKEVVSELYFAVIYGEKNNIFPLNVWKAYTIKEIIEAKKRRGEKRGISKKQVQRDLKALGIKPVNKGKKPLRYDGNQVRHYVIAHKPGVGPTDLAFMAYCGILDSNQHIQTKADLTKFITTSNEMEGLAKKKTREKRTGLLSVCPDLPPAYDPISKENEDK